MTAEATRFVIDDSHLLQCNLSDVLNVKAEPVLAEDADNMHEAAAACVETSIANMYVVAQDVDSESDKDLIIEETIADDELRQHTLELRQAEDGSETYFCIECDAQYASLEEITMVHGHGADVDIMEEQQWEVVADTPDEQAEMAIKAEAAELEGANEFSVAENEEVVDASSMHGTEECDKFLCEKCQCIFHDLKTAEQHACEPLPAEEQNQQTAAAAEDEEFIVDFACHICCAIFETKEQLATHCQQLHQPAQQHTCTLCNADFDTLVALLEHKTVAHACEDTLQQCELCGNEFKTLKTLMAHLRRGCKTQQKKKITRPVVCDICNTQFGSEKSLKFHMRIHQARTKKSIQDVLPAGAELKYSELNQFFCEICNKSFDQNLLTVHKNMHQNVELHVCSICNRQFENLTSYEMHLQLHATQADPQTRFPMRTEGANGKQLPYACQYCGRAFGRPYEKVKHERIHTGEKPYECEVCGKCFRVSYSLTMHLRTHTDIRPYVCTICNARFKSKPVYAHHLRSHQNERPYKCDTCPKTFRTSVRLNAHRNSHRKPFTCTECNRPFASLYAVKMHMKTHSKAHKANENLKHRCQICGAEYARSFALRYHMHEAHQVKLEGGVDSDTQNSPQAQGIYDIITQSDAHDELPMETVVCNEFVEQQQDTATDTEDEAAAASGAGHYAQPDLAALNETERATQMISQPNSYGIYFLD